MKEKITAIYIRVSTDFQAEEGYSIDAQKSQLSAYCIAKDWKKYEFYVDGGWSGSNINRPEIQRLVEDCKNKKIERVLVYKLDRLSRSQKDTLYLIEDVFNENNVDFVSLTESLDTSTAMGKLMIGILAAFAQLERENIRLRTRMGMKERVKAGYWMGGGRIPYGYDYDREQGILVINPEQAEKVKQAHKFYVEGYSPQKIADMLGFKYEKNVSNILNKKCYYGIIEYDGAEYQGRHEAIIDKETYDKTQAIMTMRSKVYAMKSENLLSGMVICGHCGARMRYMKWGKNSVRLYCNSHQTSKKYLIKDPNCPQKAIETQIVEDAVMDVLFKVEIKKTPKKEETKVVNKYDALLKQQSDLKNKIRRLYSLYGDAEDDLLLDEIERVKRQLDVVSEELNEHIEYLNNLNKKKISYESTDNLKERWSNLNIMQKQQICRALINSIVIKDEDIEINMNI